MLAKYQVESEVPAIFTSAHPLLVSEKITQIEFFGLGEMPPMKQVLLVPDDLSVPPHLRNENVVTYRVPGDYVFTKIKIGEGIFGERTLIMAQIFYTTGEEEHHHDHILVD